MPVATEEGTRVKMEEAARRGALISGTILTDRGMWMRMASMLGEEEVAGAERIMTASEHITTNALMTGATAPITTTATTQGALDVVRALGRTRLALL